MTDVNLASIQSSQSCFRLVTIRRARKRGGCCNPSCGELPYEAADDLTRVAREPLRLRVRSRASAARVAALDLAAPCAARWQLRSQRSPVAGEGCWPSEGRPHGYASTQPLGSETPATPRHDNHQARLRRNGLRGGVQSRPGAIPPRHLCKCSSTGVLRGRLKPVVAEEGDNKGPTAWVVCLADVHAKDGRRHDVSSCPPQEVAPR